MENKIGVVNPNTYQQVPDLSDINMPLLFISVFTGMVMGCLVMAVIVWIMRGAFNIRTNAASIIAAFFLSGLVFMVYGTAMTIYTKDIWLISSVILWTATFMGSLWILQPPSLEQLVEKTRADVEKMEKRLDKEKKREAQREAKKAEKEARKVEKARGKAVVVKTTESNITSGTEQKKDLS